MADNNPNFNKPNNVNLEDQELAKELTKDVNDELKSKRESNNRFTGVQVAILVGASFISVLVGSAFGKGISYKINGNPYYSSRLNIIQHEIKYHMRDIKENILIVDYESLSIEQIIINNKNIPVEFKEPLIDIVNKIIIDFPPHRILNIKENLYYLKLTKGESNNSISGFYSSLDDHITIYYDDRALNYFAELTEQGIYIPPSQKEDDYFNYSLSTLAHEAWHLCTSWYDAENNIHHSGLMIIKDGVKMGVGLNEGVSELVNSKKHCYKGDSFFNYEYSKLRAHVGMLCEIIGMDKVYQAYCSGNQDIIIDELTYIYGTREEATEILLSLDDIYYAECQYEKMTALGKKETPEVAKKREQTESEMEKLQTILQIRILKYFHEKMMMGLDMGLYTRENKDEFYTKMDYFKHLLYSSGRYEDSSNIFRDIEYEIVSRFKEMNNMEYTPVNLASLVLKEIEKDYFCADGERFVIKRTKYQYDRSGAQVPIGPMQYEYIFVSKPKAIQQHGVETKATITK